MAGKKKQSKMSKFIIKNNKEAAKHAETMSRMGIETLDLHSGYFNQSGFHSKGGNQRKKRIGRHSYQTELILRGGRGR